MNPRTKCVSLYILIFLTVPILSKLIPVVHTSAQAKPSPVDSKPVGLPSAVTSRDIVQENHAMDTVVNPLVRTFPVQKPTFLQRVVTWFKQALPFRSSAAQDELSSDFIPSSSRSSHTDFREARVADVDVAFQNPFAPRALRGVALLFHGCSQSAKDWFQLPEHKMISFHLLKKRFALLALTSQNRVTGCWSTRFPGGENDDVMRVKVAVRQWVAEQGLAESTALIGVGVSSGATLLSILSLDLPIVSQALYLSAGNQRALRNATSKYPSTLFVHQANDHYYAPPSSISASRHILVRKKVAMVGELSLERVPFTGTTFHEHEPLVTKQVSQQIYEAADQSERKVAQVLRANKLSDESLQRSVLQIARVMRGAHELSAMHVDKVTKWLAAQSNKAERKE